MFTIRKKICGDEVNKEIARYLQEAAQDAKVLRNINIDYIKKEEAMAPNEEIRDYFARIQSMERDPDYANPVFPQELVDWVGSLPNNHFPTNGRKRFAKWLGNTIYYEETDGDFRPGMASAFKNLERYANEVRYIADYLNGGDNQSKDIWGLAFNQMLEQAREWHDTLKDVEPTGDYESKKVEYEFENGFTIVNVDTRNDLNIEGELMGHCVGGYCELVEKGESFIYSLRDRKNKPHATIEVDGNKNIEQIKGKGNQAPIEKYKPMLKQWLETTDLKYKDSYDYLNILSPEEIHAELVAGNLSDGAQRNLMKHSKDPAVLDYFLNSIERYSIAPKEDVEVRISSREKVQDIIVSLSQNRTLGEDARLKLLKINLNLKVLGTSVSNILGTNKYSRSEEGVNWYRLTSSLWAELGEEIMRDPNDEKVYYMLAIMESGEAAPRIKEEILNYALSDEFINIAHTKGDRFVSTISLPYGGIIQQYLFQKSPDRKQVMRLYTSQRNNKFQSILGQVGRINGYIASSRGMSDELADEIIKDIKANHWWQMNQSNWIDLINNSHLSDSRRIQLLNVGGSDRSISGMTSSDGPGLNWYISGKSWSRQLVRASEEGAFSGKFVKYMIDAGIFDPHYVLQWAGSQTKRTGKSPNLKHMDGEEKAKILNNARNYAYRDFEQGAFRDDIFEEGVKKMDNLQEEIKVYLKKKNRPFGNIEDIDPNDMKIIDEWIDDLREDEISDRDKGGIEVSL